MPELKPEIGLVIRHAYLGWNEARKGREEGGYPRGARRWFGLWIFARLDDPRRGSADQDQLT
jgi:hypothetical protein